MQKPSHLMPKFLLIAALYAVQLSCIADIRPSGVQCTLSGYGVSAGCTVTADSPSRIDFRGSALTRFLDQEVSETGVNGFVRSEVANVGIDLNASGYAHDQFFVRGSAGAAAAWNDTVMLINETVAFGTPVRMRATHALSANTAHNSTLFGPQASFTLRSELDSTFAMEWRDPENQYRNLVDNMNFVEDYSGRILQEYDIDTYVGATLTLSYLMSAAMQWELSQPVAHTTDASSFIATINSGNSGHVFLDSLSLGLKFMASSGHDYASPALEIPVHVPEPSAAALVSIAFAALIGLRSRKITACSTTEQLSSSRCDCR